MITQTSGAIQGSVMDIWNMVMLYVPSLVAGILLVCIGWILGLIVYRVVYRIARWLHIDAIMQRAGLQEAAREVGFSLNVSKFLATLGMIAVFLVFLLAAFQVMGLLTVTLALEQVVLLYVPHVIVAALVIILAAFVADVVRRFVSHSASAIGSRHGRIAGTIAHWAIWIFAVLTALTELGIGADYLRMLFAGFVIAASLAAGLAFGLGGREEAAALLRKAREDMSHRE